MVTYRDVGQHTRCCGHQLIIRLLIILCAWIVTAGYSVTVLAQTDVQLTAITGCELKTDPQECAVKEGEQIRALPKDKVVEDQIASGERHIYSLTLTQGQFFQAEVEQLGVDLTVLLCIRGGQRLAEVDRQSGSWGPEKISLLVPSTGEYLLQVRPLDRGAQGHYQLKVKELRDARPLDQVRVDAERIVTEGGKFYAKGKPDCLRESISKYEEALKLFESLDDQYEVAVTLYGLGWSYTDLGSYGAVKFPEPHYRLRWSYESREEHLTAFKYFDRALEIMRSLSNQHGQAIALTGRAWPNLYLDHGEAALNDFAQARQIFQAMGNKPGEVRAVYGLGWANALLNNNEQALEHFRYALRLRQELGDNRGGANTLASISRIYSRLNQNQDALDYAQRALKLYQELKDVHGQASTLTILGWIYRALGARADALESFKKAFELRDASDSTGRANALYGMARIESEQGELPQALVNMKAVIDLIDPLREKGSTSDLRTYYFANVQDYYEFYIDLLMRMNRLGLAGGSAEEALRINERAHARELLSVLAESDEGQGHEYDAGLGAPLDAAGIKEMLDDNTVLLEYALGAERSYLWLVSPKEILSYELPGRLVIEAQALRLYTLLTERNRPESTRSEQRIERADAEAQTVAVELSKLLFGPAAERLSGKRLVIVTQGALELVPLGALPSPEAHAQAAKTTVPLIADHEIISLPSASVLAVLRSTTGRRQRAAKTVAVLADPVFTRDDLRVRLTPPAGEVDQRTGAGDKTAPVATASLDDYLNDQTRRDTTRRNYRRLPGSRWEAQQILSLVPKQEAYAALGFAASRDTALSGVLRDYQIVHFATHAFVDDSHPALSKIVLSQFDEKGRAQNGNLTLNDIYRMKLHADLVVLSACRTGLGADTKGEGFIGLTGGFMHSGVPRVLVSLWPISDQVAAEFMARFYRKLLGPQKLPPAAALRETQLELWRDARWSSAYYWAPFVFNGEWRWR